MIRCLFVLVSVSGGSHIFFPSSLSSPFFYSSVCLVELGVRCLQARPLPVQHASSVQKHVKMGAPGMGLGWNAAS